MPFLQVSPSGSITFELFANKTSNAELILRNNISSPVIYKVTFIQIKTTAPKSYIVKPNHGLIMPEQTSTVHIAMQLSSEQPESKHKFLVLSCKTNMGPNDSQEEVRRMIDNCAKPLIQQIKLDVSFANVIDDNKSSLYEEAIYEPRRSLGTGLPEIRKSTGMTLGAETRTGKKPLDLLVVMHRQKRKIDEKLELERKLHRLHDEESERLKRSQAIASNLYAEKQGNSESVSFLHILLALFAGILVGFTVLRQT